MTNVLAARAILAVEAWAEWSRALPLMVCHVSTGSLGVCCVNTGCMGVCPGGTGSLVLCRGGVASLVVCRGRLLLLLVLLLLLLPRVLLLVVGLGMLLLVLLGALRQRAQVLRLRAGLKPWVCPLEPCNLRDTSVGIHSIPGDLDSRAGSLVHQGHTSQRPSLGGVCAGVPARPRPRELHDRAAQLAPVGEHLLLRALLHDPWQRRQLGGRIWCAYVRPWAHPCYGPCPCP